jgi:hypothetical protein
MEKCWLEPYAGHLGRPRVRLTKREGIMHIKGVVFGLVVLALGAGVAFAAATPSATSGLDVCVNNTNGAMRVASECRDGEHRVTLGGGGNATATQNGVFSVAVGTTGGSKTLPLTGLILSGRCETIPAEFGGGMLARPSIESASGTTMDAFGSTPPSVVGGSSLTLPPVGVATPSFTDMSSKSVIVTSNGATATITFGGYVDQASGDCRFLWQAVEVANS